MKKYLFNKLIRNKLPERMEKEGVIVNGAKLGPEEYIKELKNKLIEEAKEVLEASDINNLIIELADVIEVVRAIAEANDINVEKIEKARLEKRNVNGHFAPEHYVNYIEVDENNKDVTEYLESKDRHYNPGFV